MNKQKIDEILGDSVVAAINALGGSATKSASEVRAYAAERTAKLTMAVGHPGFEKAAEHEAVNVAMFAGIEAVKLARVVDGQTIGLIQGAMAFAARAAVMA